MNVFISASIFYRAGKRRAKTAATAQALLPFSKAVALE
jgi:hypothetical protein